MSEEGLVGGFFASFAGFVAGFNMAPHRLVGFLDALSRSLRYRHSFLRPGVFFLGGCKRASQPLFSLKPLKLQSKTLNPPLTERYLFKKMFEALSTLDISNDRACEVFRVVDHFDSKTSAAAAAVGGASSFLAQGEMKEFKKRRPQGLGNVLLKSFAKLKETSFLGCLFCSFRWF